MSTLIPLASALITVTIAAITDARSGRIPNWLTGASLALALTVGALDAGGPGAARAALSALFVALAPAILFFTSRGRHVGGGDVKVLGALGAWLGPAFALEAILLALVGLVLFVVLTRQRGSVRLGPALALGMWARALALLGTLA